MKWEPAPQRRPTVRRLILVILVAFTLAGLLGATASASPAPAQARQAASAASAGSGGRGGGGPAAGSPAAGSPARSVGKSVPARSAPEIGLTAPRPEDAATYGAWAWSGTGGLPAALSVAGGATAAQAEASAVTDCQAAGGGTGGNGACFALAWFVNADSSLAFASNGAWGVGWDSTSGAADSYALSYCQQSGGTDCQVVGRAATPDTSSPDGGVIEAAPSYGVWAISPTAQLAAWGVGDSVQSAQQAASANCVSAGGVAAECATYGAWAENGYSAISRGSNGTWSIGIDVSPASAQNLAQHECQTVKAVGYDCTLKGTNVTGDPWVGSDFGWIDQPNPADAVPAAPSGLTATATDPHDIKLTWQDNSGNESGFEISNGVTSTTVGANSTAYTWGGLAPNTYMCFKVRSTNSAGTSPWDPNVSPWYVCATTPPEPTIYWSQTDGPPGTHFTVTGSGWLPGGTVQASLSSGSTGDFYFSSASSPVDSHGGWHASITVGDAPVGTYQLTFRESSDNLQVSGTFHVSAAPASPNENWDGYAQLYAAKYTSVSASWTEPKYPLLAGKGVAGFWVGLGGIGSTLQQVGTAVGYGMKFENGKQTSTYYAWWETVTDDPKGHPSLIKKPVKPGDKFNASVTYNGQAYVLELTDLTESWSFTRINQQAQDNTSTAEVIMESPSGFHLPFFLSPVTFSDIKVNGAPMQNPTPELLRLGRHSASYAGVSSFQNNSFTAYPWRL